MARFLLAVAFLALVALASAQTPDDFLIKSLPGLKTQPKFKMYSGYVVHSDNVHSFFWFLESADSPATDPLVQWTNGGPGCSSLLGFFMENGPFQADADGNLVDYPWSWNAHANVLYVESPAYVGFSFWPGHGSLTKYDDNSTAYHSYEFLERWINIFTQYKNRHFVISGESYAGHYIPEVSALLLQKPIPGLNFVGVMIGNPYVDGAIDDGPMLENWLRAHAVKSLAGEGKEYPDGLDPYNVLGDTCDLDQARFPTRWNGYQWGTSALDFAREKFESGKHARYVFNPVADCLANGYTKDYLHRLDVQAAIHATPPNPNSWSPCAEGLYVGRAPTVIPIIRNMMDNSDLTIWIYSGDNDYICNFLSTESWILAENRTEVSPWQAWTYTQPYGIQANSVQIAGFQNVFDRITFRTVKGAGHEVPRTQPAPALQLITDFLAQIAKEHSN